jgi:lipopolysaccharide/colanic/teichoic acid biosynthesis glycosyltransferase
MGVADAVTIAAQGSMDVREPDPAVVAAAEVDWGAALPRRASRWSWRAGQGVKRVFDIVVAGTGLVLLIPLFVVLTVAIVVDSGWPALYPWRVVGYRGRRFTGYKLRTMVRDADQLKTELTHLNQMMNGPVFKMRSDPRITRLGRILRRYSFDELPQLLSVVIGDMSLVGPRPLFPEEFVRARPEQRRKLAVRPGITCLWQVSGRAQINDFDEWVRLDREYIETWSLRLDLRILLRTVRVVVLGTGAF